MNALGDEWLVDHVRHLGFIAGNKEGPDGGVVFVFGLVTYHYATGDEAGRRLAAVQLVLTKAASVPEVESAFAVNTANGVALDERVHRRGDRRDGC